MAGKQARGGRSSSSGGGKGKDFSGAVGLIGGLLDTPAEEGQPGGKNPAFGAKGPEDVSYSYKGDPSSAISKFGTSNPNVPITGFWSRLFQGDKAKQVDSSNLNARVAGQLEDESNKKNVGLKRDEEQHSLDKATDILLVHNADKYKGMDPDEARAAAKNEANDLGVGNVLQGAQIAKANRDLAVSQAQMSGDKARISAAANSYDINAAIAEAKAKTQQATDRESISRETTPGLIEGEKARSRADVERFNNEAIQGAKVNPIKRDTNYAQAKIDLGRTENQLGRLGTTLETDSAVGDIANKEATFNREQQPKQQKVLGSTLDHAIDKLADTFKAQDEATKTAIVESIAKRKATPSIYAGEAFKGRTQYNNPNAAGQFELTPNTDPNSPEPYTKGPMAPNTGYVPKANDLLGPVLGSPTNVGSRVIGPDGVARPLGGSVGGVRKPVGRIDVNEGQKDEQIIPDNETPNPGFIQPPQPIAPGITPETSNALIQAVQNLQKQKLRNSRYETVGGGIGGNY